MACKPLSVHSLTLAAAVLCAFTAAAHADVVIGNFEGSSDGWFDWSTASANSGQGTPITDGSTFGSNTYHFSSTGATLGSSALQLTQSGWAQDISLKLEYNNLMSAFFANNALQFDVTLPATTDAGWSQLYDVALNAPSWGFTSLLSTNPDPNASWGWGAGGGPQQTYTVTVPYSNALATIPSNAGYAEFIFAFNNDGVGTHTNYYIDNVRLVTVPEPASMSLLGLGALCLARRPRRR